MSLPYFIWSPTWNRNSSVPNKGIHFSVTFYCDQSKAVCVIIMFNQDLYMPDLTDGWIILANR